MTEFEELTSFELQRLRALASADIERARAMHHPDFQLITPFGVTLTKGQYLDAIGSGALRYLRWETETMTGRVRGAAGALRYRSTIEVVLEGNVLPVEPHWHTDYYEKDEGAWRVVFSQATRVA